MLRNREKDGHILTRATKEGVSENQMEYIRASSVYTGTKWSREKYESGHTKCPGAKMTHWSF